MHFNDTKHGRWSVMSPYNIPARISLCMAMLVFDMWQIHDLYKLRNTRRFWWKELYEVKLGIQILYSFLNIIFGDIYSYPRQYYRDSTRCCVERNLKVINKVFNISIWGTVYARPIKCLFFSRQTLVWSQESRCQQRGLHSCIRTSKSNKGVYNDRFSLVSVNVRVKIQWLQLEWSENQQPIPGPRMWL